MIRGAAETLARVAAVPMLVSSFTLVATLSGATSLVAVFAIVRRLGWRCSDAKLIVKEGKLHVRDEAGVLRPVGNGGAGGGRVGESAHAA